MKKDVTVATVATVEQGLLDYIQLTLDSANPDDVYVEGLQMAVTAYKEFQHAQAVKPQFKASESSESLVA